MVRPAHFGFNEQTAGSNAFQERTTTAGALLRQKAQAEFDEMVELLRAEGVDSMPTPATGGPTGRPPALA